MRFPHRQETDARSAHLAVPFVRWQFWIQMLEIPDLGKTVTFARFLWCFVVLDAVTAAGATSLTDCRIWSILIRTSLIGQNWRQAFGRLRFWRSSRDRWPGMVTSNFVKTLLCVKQDSLHEIGHKHFCENAFPEIAAQDWSQAMLWTRFFRDRCPRSVTSIFGHCTRNSFAHFWSFQIQRWGILLLGRTNMLMCVLMCCQHAYASRVV